jgi:hypothetical protein
MVSKTLEGGGSRFPMIRPHAGRADLGPESGRLAIDGGRGETLHANMGGHTGVPQFEGDDGTGSSPGT